MLFSTLCISSSILLVLQLVSGAVAAPAKGVAIFLDDGSTGTLVARDLTVDQQNALNIHNQKVRARLKIPALVWDTSLDDEAKKWAQHLASINKAVRSNQSTRPGMGGNIFSLTGSGPMINAGMAWVKEQAKFNLALGNIFTDKIASQGVSNYTQIVWRNTTRVGIAAVKNTTVSGSSTWYVVARYSPQGNIIGKQIY